LSRAFLKKYKISIFEVGVGIIHNNID